MRIDENDLAFGVDDNNAVGGRLKQAVNVGWRPFGVLTDDLGRDSAEETHEFPLAEFLSGTAKQWALYTELVWPENQWSLR